MKWEHLLKKQWTEDDYDHPVVKRIFRSIEAYARKQMTELTYEANMPPQFKALKLFEDVCSKYEISLMLNPQAVAGQDPQLLLVKLPNSTFVAVPFGQNFSAGATYRIYPEAIIYLKDEYCPICIRPNSRELPFFFFFFYLI